MAKVVLGARILLGAAWLVFGLNGFLHFFTPPPPAADDAKAFLGALAASHYVYPTISLIEVLSGAALLSGFFVPLAATLLAPIVLNIVLYHLALDMAGTGLGVFLLILNVLVAFGYRSSFKGVLAAKPQ